MKPRVNVFIHGDSGCGKTSLVRSLLSQNPRAAPYPREDLSIRPWKPSEAEWHNIVGADEIGYEKSLEIQLWDLSGNQVLRAVQSLTLTPEALHVLVIDATRFDPASVVDVWNQIHFRALGSEVLLVLTKTDRLVLDIDGFEELQTRILKALRQNEELHITTIQEYIQRMSTFSAGEKYTSHLQSLLNRRPIIPDSVEQLSCKSGKGIRELSRKILTTLLDGEKFPHCRLRARLCQDGVPLEEMLEGFKQGPETLLSLRSVEEYLSTLTPNESLENMIKLLHKTGAIIDFRDVTRMRTGGHLVCVDPETFVRLLTSAHVTDIKKTFRIEASQFWPKQSGFKRPSPNLLSKVLEKIPTKGLIRESLFPILWQDLELDEEQILLLLDLLERLGLISKYLTTLSDCEGLVMPDYPNLSVNKQYLAVVMDTLPDKKPSLNWTSRPIAGDLQLGWRYWFPLGAPLSFLKMILATCQKVGEDSQTYIYQWKYGLLMRITQGIICVTHEKDHVTITCRVDANESGGETEAIQRLWRILHPYIEETTRLLHTQTGLFYKLLLVPDGEAFFSPHELVEEVALSLVEYFTAWLRDDTMTVQSKGNKVKINTEVLFPFPDCKNRTHTLDDWLDTVSNRSSENGEPDSLPNDIPFTRQPSYFRGSRRKKRHSSKKHMGIKWHLESGSTDQTVTNSNQPVIAEVPSEVKETMSQSYQPEPFVPGQVVSKETEHEGTVSEQGVQLSPADRDQDGNGANKKVPYCSVNVTDETQRMREVRKRSGGSMRGCNTTTKGNKEKCTVISGSSVSEETMKQAATVFTSTILAKGVLQYIEEERSTNPKWKGMVSHKQIQAARRVAALPNSSAPHHYNQGLYQLAQSVIEAINNAPNNEPHCTRSRKSNKSFLCVLF